MLAVGIGCLWFSRKDIPRKLSTLENFDFEAHFASLKKELEAIPNISNIEVHTPKLNMYMLYDDDDEDELAKFFPCTTQAAISFSINLPSRVQTLHHLREPNTGSENFNVLLNWANEAPVAYMSYEAADANVSPSSAIVVVRKFLENHFENNSKKFSFETIGPSPMHADFYISGNEFPSESEPIMSIRDESFAGVGYKDFRITYNPQEIENDNVALKIFIARYTESIASYYRTICYRNHLLDRSRETHSHLQDLLKVQTQPGLRGVVKRLFHAPKISKDLSISLLSEELSKMDLLEHLTSSKREQSLLPDSPFEEFAAAEVEGAPSRPSSSIREVIGLFEERYLKNLENMTVIGAGVFGGIIGSTITYLLGK
ncbi:UNVERIFIED_CONTAM: hypothetical protein Q9R58_07770 [Methylobacteriaceae bacterium AG10]|nr:hypothetical protein [Methylobacteriaceae bacterium AG10]